jgi:hypothetical protein
VYLILFEDYTPQDAANFAQKYLALANPQFVDWVRNYQLPTGAAKILSTIKAAKKKTLGAKTGAGAKAGAGVKAVTSKTARSGRRGSAGAKRIPAKNAKRP